MYTIVYITFLLFISTKGLDRVRYIELWIDLTSCIINLPSFNIILSCTAVYDHSAECTAFDESFDVPLPESLMCKA